MTPGPVIPFRPFALQATPDYWREFHQWRKGEAVSPAYRIIHPNPHQMVMRAA